MVKSMELPFFDCTVSNSIPRIIQYSAFVSMAMSAKPERKNTILDKFLLFSVSFSEFCVIDFPDGIFPKNLSSLSSQLQIHDLTIPENHEPSFAAQQIHVLSRTR